jgi:hypothetical protein
MTSLLDGYTGYGTNNKILFHLQYTVVIAHEYKRSLWNGQSWNIFIIQWRFQICPVCYIIKELKSKSNWKVPSSGM